MTLLGGGFQKETQGRSRSGDIAVADPRMKIEIEVYARRGAG